MLQGILLLPDSVPLSSVVLRKFETVGMEDGTVTPKPSPNFDSKFLLMFPS